MLITSKHKDKDNFTPQQFKSQFTGCWKVLLYEEPGNEGVGIHEQDKLKSKCPWKIISEEMKIYSELELGR